MLTRLNPRLYLISVAFHLSAIFITSTNAQACNSIYGSDAMLAEDLFAPYRQEVFRIADQIERDEPISVEAVQTLKQGLDQPYGGGTTLLALAVECRNLQAVETLLEAGADIRVPFSETQPERFNYVSEMLTVTQHDRGQTELFLNGLITLYLKYGGDANDSGLSNVSPDGRLLRDLVVYDNPGGFRLVVEAGGDPWLIGRGREPPMLSLAHDTDAMPLLNWLIDGGFFDNRTQDQLMSFIRSLAISYSDPPGRRARQEVLRRVLKRNPGYPDDEYTQALLGGPIPWKAIMLER